MEIEFRVWDSHFKKFIYNNDDKGDGFVVFSGEARENNYGDLGSVSSWGKLYQYTGLKDKNGTKIYVGDIFEYKGIHGVVKLGRRFESLEFHIDWEDAIFKTATVTNLREDLYFWVEHRELTVVGNIHENKELLK